MGESKRKRTGRVNRGAAVVAHRVAGTDWSYIATNADHANICLRFANQISRSISSRIHAAVRLKHSSRAVVCFSRLTDLTDELVLSLKDSKITKHILFVSGLPIEAMTSRLKALKIRSLDRLHLVDKENPASEAMLIRRFFVGMTDQIGNPTITDAWIEGDELVLLSASFQRLRIPRSKLDRFLGNNRDKWLRFEIDEDGSFLHWPHADVHFGWKQFEQLVDPTKSIQDQKKNDQFKRLYGNAIRMLRESVGLKQIEIDGVTDRQLRRIEHGEQMASPKALESLAKAHGLDVSDYMNRLAALTAQAQPNKT